MKISLKYVPRVQLIIFQYCFKLRVGAGPATGHYLNQWWLSLIMHICVTQPQWVNNDSTWVLCLSDLWKSPSGTSPSQRRRVSSKQQPRLNHPLPETPGQKPTPLAPTELCKHKDTMAGKTRSTFLSLCVRNPALTDVTSRFPTQMDSNSKVRYTLWHSYSQTYDFYQLIILWPRDPVVMRHLPIAKSNFLAWMVLRISLEINKSDNHPANHGVVQTNK